MGEIKDRDVEEEEYAKRGFESADAEGLLCEKCGCDEWKLRYGDYELWGQCRSCGYVKSLYSG